MGGRQGAQLGVLRGSDPHRWGRTGLQHPFCDLRAFREGVRPGDLVTTDEMFEGPLGLEKGGKGGAWSLVLGSQGCREGPEGDAGEWRPPEDRVPIWSTKEEEHR